MKGSRVLSGRNFGPGYSYPMGIWFSVFFLLPIGIIVTYSFLKKGVHGGVLWQFSLDAYGQMFHASYAKLFVRTIWITFVSTLISILVALPCGYAMARSKYQTLLLFLIIIPFWTNSLIRINAWIAILGNEGFINGILQKMGIIQDSIQFLYNQNAVILVMIYMYLPYAILPIFTAMDKFDFSLLEAARDLGATKAQSMFKVLLPNVRSGIVTAIIFTFIPIFGAYTVPLLVGGMDSYMLGNVVVDQVTKVRNWPLASSFSVLITIASTLGVLWMMGTSAREAARMKAAANLKQETGV